MARHIHIATAAPRTAQVTHPPVASSAHAHATPTGAAMQTVTMVWVRDARMKGA